MARVQCIDENGQVVNLGQVAAWDGEGGGLTPGMYCFQIDEVEQTQTQKGKPQLHLKMTVIGGDTDVHNGQGLQDWRSLAGKKGALGRLKALLDACGVALDSAGGFDDQQLIGRQFWAEAFEDDVPNPTPEEPERTKKVTRIRKEQAPEGQAAPAAAPPAPVAAQQPPAAPVATAAPSAATQPRVAGPGVRPSLPRPAAPKR